MAWPWLRVGCSRDALRAHCGGFQAECGTKHVLGRSGSIEGITKLVVTNSLAESDMRTMVTGDRALRCWV